MQQQLTLDGLRGEGQLVKETCQCTTALFIAAHIQVY